MSLIEDIIQYNSLSIVGIEKNTGKTECLNYILNNIPFNKTIAVTSIGVDGETIDQVIGTKKPEINLRKGIFYGTSEAYFKSRKLVSSIISLSEEETSLGRIITAEVIESGKIILSGPSSKSNLVKWIKEGKIGSWGKEIDLFIIDGVLSRLSSASPVISESMILTTGASVSPKIEEIISKTLYIVKLINLECVEEQIKKLFSTVNHGIWIINNDEELISLNVLSPLLINTINYTVLENCKYLYLKGALIDSFLDRIMQNKKLLSIQIVIDDFTKIFISPQKYNLFIKMGGKIKVMEKSKLIAVCINPTSPHGRIIESKLLQQELEKVLNIPVYDVRRI